MQGEKIERAKESAIILARSLSPNDLISIVTFEYKVKVLLAPTLAFEQTEQLLSKQKYRPLQLCVAKEQHSDNLSCPFQSIKPLSFF